MQTSQASSLASGSTAGSAGSGRAAAGARSRARRPAQDPNQPTLHQFFARAATGKATVSTAANPALAAPGSSPSTSDSAAVGSPRRAPGSPAVQCTTTAPLSPYSRTREPPPAVSPAVASTAVTGGSALASAVAAAAATALPSSPVGAPGGDVTADVSNAVQNAPASPWAAEAEVLSLRRRRLAAGKPAAAATTASTAGLAVPTPAVRQAAPNALAAGRAPLPPTGAINTRPSAARFLTPSCSAAAAAAPGGHETPEQHPEAEDVLVSQLTAGVARLGLAPPPRPAAAATAATTAVDVITISDSDEDSPPGYGQHTAGYGNGKSGQGTAARSPLPPPLTPSASAPAAAAAPIDPAAAAAAPAAPVRRTRIRTTPVTAPTSAAAAVASEPAEMSTAPPSAASAAALASAAPGGGAVKPRGRAKAKGPRSGRAPGGALLWTELAEEERAATGGPGWIRWEAVDPPGDDPQPIYQLFSVDVETVDFMRGPQTFPRPDQVRLLEVAAVDMGPYDTAAAAAAAAAAADLYGTSAVAAAGTGDRGSGLVFSTLVNCGRSFKDHKTVLHNGITWKESSAPGVPHTARALEQFFDFIHERSAATAAAASSATAAAGGRAGPVTVVPVLMAHNGAAFDFPVLRSECGRVGVGWPQEWWYLDTLLAAKVLWAKPQWPTKPAGEGEGAEEAGGEEEEGEEGADGGGAPGGGKKSLSMDALKLWAGVTSGGRAHRAAVDALDLAAIWRPLFERFGRPDLTHLERLSSGRPGAKAAAGPMHRLGLLSAAAKADGLVRHMNAAVAPLLPLAPSAAAVENAGGPSVVLSTSEFRELLEGGRLHLRKSSGGGGGGGGFWVFEPVRERPAAVAGAISAEAHCTASQQVPYGATQTNGSAQYGGNGHGYGSQQQPTQAGSQQYGTQQHIPYMTQQQQEQQRRSSSLEPFVVLLRGVKLRYMAAASYAYKDTHAPKWDLTLLPAGSTKTGAGGEGVAGADEVAELVALLDGLARQASLLARGDAGAASQLYSCAKDDGRRKAITVQLHAQLSYGPSPRQLNWQPLATLSMYDKKTSSYKPVPWPKLVSYTPQSQTEGAGAAAGVSQAAPGGGGGPCDRSGSVRQDPELERIKADNLSRIVAHLPDVASSEVLDVAVWPQFCWVNNRGCGVRLTALHIVRRSGR